MGKTNMDERNQGLAVENRDVILLDNIWLVILQSPPPVIELAAAPSCMSMLVGALFLWEYKEKTIGKTWGYNSPLCPTNM